ncbi:polysaccharide deacetylase family protein [Paenibacillus sp. NPDC058071]|uniref:polysaccharide deacetylase family protein n=1 Tax=Paenibacillus sp. NPDC058071 TaxID=3346326 RepID=UPI0036DB28A6
MQPSIIEQVSTKKKRLAITINIATGSHVPNAMLDLLRKHGVREATFFLTGMWVKANPGIARRIKKMGFEIASHGHQHKNYTTKTNAWIEKDILTAQKYIYRATGVKPRMIRTPSGDIDMRVARKLQSLKQTIVHWDTDSLDWKLQDINHIVRRVVPCARPGSIVLLHACDPWTQSLKAVPLILSGLKKRGFKFVSVSQLLSVNDHARLK